MLLCFLPQEPEELDCVGEEEQNKNKKQEMMNKPHAICIPLPFPSHINSTFKFAELLHHKGFHITFVNTEFNQKRFLTSKSADDFRFETIPDGLTPPSDPDSAPNPAKLFQSIIQQNFLDPFTDLIAKLNNQTLSPDVPPVSCIVSDVSMPFTVTAAENLGGIPLVMLVPFSACAFMVYKQFPALVQNGLIPLRDESLLTDEYLDSVIDWIPGMNDIRLRHLPRMVRETKPFSWLLDHHIEMAEKSSRASAIVFHTFDALEQQVLNASAAMFPATYAIGPFQLLLNQQQITQQQDRKDAPNSTSGYSLWKEENVCLQWLDSKISNSVVYVSFGSMVSMKKEELIEFGMGLANTNYPFLWVIRSNMVIGEASALPPEFMEEIKDRGFITNWCPQEKVLNHWSIGCFVTHSGWNSTIESISAGVPMLCWPKVGDQPTNCKYTCDEWGIGMEIDEDVERDGVERLVIEMMEGEKGVKMKERTMEWKKLAEEAIGPNGSSSKNLDKLVKQLVCI